MAAIMILNKNTKVQVPSPDGDTDIVPGILQGDTLSRYQFIICLDYVFRMSSDLIKETDFPLKKVRGRRYLAQTITDANYADDITHLEITPAQSESLLHSLEQAAGSIGLHVNADKTECICFNQIGDISTLSGYSQKLVDKLTYLGSSVSSIENGIQCAWIAIDRLSLISE